MADTKRRAIPARRSRVSSAATTAASDVLEDDTFYEDRHMGSSALRYQQRPTGQRNTDQTQVVPLAPGISRIDPFGRPVVRQGNREYVMVPANTVRRRIHWTVYVGILMLVMLLGWVGLSAFGSWWTDWRNYTTYGYPRTWQTDVIVGHADSPEHPSHFIFMNMGDKAVVIEFPGGNPTKSIEYVGATLFGINPSYVPVTGRFYDANGDGRIDMEIDYGGDNQVWLNNGSKFVPPGS